MAAVENLRAKVEQGRLVTFMGSGVSATAGLPTWDDLLLHLAEGAGRTEKIDPEGWFKKLSALDKAHVVRGDRDKRSFGEAVKGLTTAHRYGLAPTLLASLPTREAVTLNYDQLYEMASDDQGRPTAVLPFEPLADSERWLLTMHGCVSRPESIVLTRGDYIDFRSEGANAASLAKALLMTKHLLFVGFGLSDDHFHDLVHEVHRSFSGAGPIGTALVLGKAEGHKEVWGSRIDFVTFEKTESGDNARDLEIFLDVFSAACASTGGHLMDPRYDSQLDDAERRARDAFQRFMEDERRTLTGTSIGRCLAELYRRSGGIDDDGRVV